MDEDAGSNVDEPPAPPTDDSGRSKRIIAMTLAAVLATIGIAIWTATHHAADNSDVKVETQTLSAAEQDAQWRAHCVDRHWTLVSNALADGDISQLYYEYGTRSPLTRPLVLSATNFQRNLVQNGRRIANAQLEDDINKVCDILEAPANADY